MHESGSFELAIPAGLAGKVSAKTSREVFVGLRPEHIALRAGTGKTKSTAKVRATVEVVEPMGNEIYLYCLPEKTSAQFVARVTAEKEPAVGKPIELTFDLSNIHLFDAATEKRLA